MVVGDSVTITFTVTAFVVKGSVAASVESTWPAPTIEATANAFDEAARLIVTDAVATARP